MSSRRSAARVSPCHTLPPASSPSPPPPPPPKTLPSSPPSLLHLYSNGSPTRPTKLLVLESTLFIRYLATLLKPPPAVAAMATLNMFELLGADDNDDPSQLIAAAEAAAQKAEAKKSAAAPAGKAAQPAAAAKFPTKPAPPSQTGES